MASNNAKWPSTIQAAGELGIGQQSVYRLIDAGELAAYRMGRVIRIRRSDIDDFVQRCRVEPGDLRHLHRAHIS